MTTYQNAAVLTGDLIKSTALSADELDRAFVQLENTVQLLKRLHGCDVFFARFRGDGWQVFVQYGFLSEGFAMALRAGVRSLGKAFDTRISFGFGDATIVNGDLDSAHGSAFVRSGQGLDQMHRADILAASGKVMPILPLLAAISSGWTVKQAEVAHLTLTRSLAAPLVEIAQELGVTPQTIKGHFDAAHMYEVAHSLSMTMETGKYD